MLSSQLAYFYPAPPPLSKDKKTAISPWVVGVDGVVWRRANTSFSSSRIVCALDKESPEYEIDREKAKEALQKLDQQFQSLSKKQVPSPKIRASDVKIPEEQTTMEEFEISGSFLGYLTVALVLFTIFYNVLFYAVIKPSIDGPIGS